MGFGWSFYGFFIVAALWIACYFVWVVASRRGKDGTIGDGRYTDTV